MWQQRLTKPLDLLIVIEGRLQAVEVKLTATPGAGHAEPLDRLAAVARGEANAQGLVVCRTETERPLPRGHVALPWQAFPGWLRDRLAGVSGKG